MYRSFYLCFFLSLLSPFSAYIILFEFSCLSTTPYTETSFLLLALKMFTISQKTMSFRTHWDGLKKHAEGKWGHAYKMNSLLRPVHPSRALHTTTFTYKLSNGRHHHQAYIFHPCLWRPRENRARIEERPSADI
jgi:hypothetical protein